MKRCPYCGKEFPPKGKRRYCSPLCQHRYNSLKTWRKYHGGPEEEHCLRCHTILKYSERGYCHKCRRNRPELIGDIDGLRKAMLKQAIDDGVMEWWPRTEAFGKLFPEIDADILMERMKGEEQ